MSDPVSTQGAAESPSEFSKDGPGIYSRWSKEIALARGNFDKWHERVEKIVERYRDETDSNEEGSDLDGGSRLNLLWATVQTELPAIYQRAPQPEVARRFKQKDPAARCASLILERYLSVDLERDRLAEEAPSVVMDRLLAGRGVAWIEYEPVIASVEQDVVLNQTAPGKFQTAATGMDYTGQQPPTPHPDAPDKFMGKMPFERIAYCAAPIRYVHWDDFLHSSARAWREVRWVARKRYWTKDQCAKNCAKGMEQFKWTPADIPLESNAKMDKALEDQAGDMFKQAVVWELWPEDTPENPDAAVIVFLVEGMSVPLEVREKKIRLEARFPCPRPYYGTITTDSLVPVPDYCEYQDVAREIDDLTARISSLTKALKVVGAYDGSAKELDKLLNEGVENQLIPVENWPAFSEQGGLTGAISWLPVEQVAKVLESCQAQRQTRIDLLYQLSGFGDLIRGQGDPRMTATQADAESNFGSLRIQAKQDALALFMADCLQIKAEIIAEMAPPDVLMAVSGIDETDDAQYAQQAIQILKQERMRDFKIEVTERSMAALDEAKERSSAQEFLAAMTGYLPQVLQATQQAPELGDLAVEMLLFTVRRFRAGRELEGTIETVMEAMKKRAEQARAQPPKPSPEEMKMQNAMQLEQTQSQNAMQLEMAKHQNALQQIQAEQDSQRATEQAQALSQAAIEQFKQQAKESEMRLQAGFDQRQAQMEAQLALHVEQMKGQIKGIADIGSMLHKVMHAPRRMTIDGQTYESKMAMDDEPGLQ